MLYLIEGEIGGDGGPRCDLTRSLEVAKIAAESELY